MSTPVDFSVKPFARGALMDIPSQFMPMGGLTRAWGVRIDDAYIEKRLGFRRISDCQYDEYILGLYQYLSPDQVPHVFFGDRYHLYHIGYGPALRFWDDGYPWWDIPGYAWDALAGGVTYELSPWGSTQICPVPGVTSESSSSSSTSESSSSLSSMSVSSSASCTTDHYPFTGRDHRDANGETSTWIFTDFAGNIIATNYEDPIVIIRGYVYDRYENLNCMGLRARIVDNFQNHLMALNTVDERDGQVVNRFWWSGLDDAEDWDYLNLASECGYADLEPSSMPITGGAKLRDSYIIYQSNMVHQLNYVGGANTFSRQVINKEIGCMSKGLLCSDGEKHFFFAQNDIWMFDGYNFKPIGINNNEYIYEGLNKAQISRAFSFIDVNTNEAHFVIPWKSTIPNLDCIYDYMHDLWTFDFLDVNGCEGATAGCPKVAFDFPFIARVGSRISSSASVSSSSSSSCSNSSSSESSSSSTSHSSQSRQSCPDQCRCSDVYTVTISGVSGTSGGFYDCSELNGTWTLSAFGECNWQNTSVGPSFFRIYLFCYQGYWHLLADNTDGNTANRWRTPNYDDCPPIGDDIAWEEIAGDCDCTSSIVYLGGSLSSSSSSSVSYTCGNDMVVNGNFESWTTPQDPEHWTLNYSGPPFAGSVNQNAAEQTDGLYSARVGHTMAASTNWTEIYQDIGIHKPITYWQGATVTLTAWVKCAVALKAEIFINDGVGRSMAFPHPGDDQWHSLTVTRTIDAAALYVRAELWVEADPASNITASFDSVWATEECSGSSSSQSSSSFSNSSSSTSGSNSSSSSKSFSQSSSSDSLSSEWAHADSFIEEVGSTLNDDGWARVSEWISGEYTTFNPEVPIDQYIKEIREITPVIVELANDVHISLGARDRTDSTTIINWETLAAFTQQELVGTTTYGRYLSFKCVASALDDYYEISEIMGSYVVAGRR